MHLLAIGYHSARWFLGPDTLGPGQHLKKSDDINSNKCITEQCGSWKAFKYVVPVLSKKVQTTFLIRSHFR